ncbi:bifunctional serine/threonine protein kinase/MFS transporter [Nocardiopsis sp. N85]|uniref:bifunctional serine/threonine protein kinase/MFS transporter n=1 Tax=Nocardiopsis sp. N85 TaxID=3029400 RepID=UPI00237F6E40|nr:bifunctional serine/threonine protein kinase/MFS transporter [Nocardiopsis sp. N85]MDE3721576.1 bifunctional serine/threonine protein kinase/MFS transporter [Nocardiopsis sp. N85]
MGEELPERIGHYVIRRRIGSGGMGVVYQAEDPRTQQFVAVKVLKPEVAGDRIARARLAREVETMRRVQSPNVAAVIDANTDAELPWVVTEYIPGPTLDATVTDHGPLRGRALTRFITGLARAIKDIHAVEVIHRDLKPGNVIISNGEPIVIDFGIAHAVDGAKLTQTGTFVGTPSYLSPEVIEGTALGPATDIHAWGGTVAFASTGRPPYGAGAFEVIFFRILNGEIDMDGMHEALRPLVARAVSRDMHRRPTATELVAEAGRLNLDLPWTEDPGNKPTGLTGSHTVHHPVVPGADHSGGRPAAGLGGGAGAAGAGGATGGSGGSGAAGAALGGAALGGAAGYLASRMTQGGNEGWGPSGSGPNPTAGAWSAPADQVSEARSESGPGGWRTDDDATDDLSGARDRGWAVDEDATDDLSGRGTDRIAPPRADEPNDPQGTMRINPLADPDDAGTRRIAPVRDEDDQGTMRIDAVDSGDGDPQGTMMLDPREVARGGGRSPLDFEEPEYDPRQAPQTQFFNTPLHKGDFSDILPPVDDGRGNRTQQFDEDDYEESGGWLDRFRRGGNDRMGGYLRGDSETGEYSEYDSLYEEGEEGDEYEDRVYRMHPLVLIPVVLALAGLGLVFPWIGIFLGILVIAGLSALDVVKAEHAKRLQTRGARNSDSVVVALSFPWAFGRMLLRTVGFGLIYLVAGILVGLVYAQIVDTGDAGANYIGGFAVFVTMLLSYLMPSGRQARHQAVWLVERIRFRNLYVYIGVIVAVVLFAMLVLSFGFGSAPDWRLGPLQGPSDWVDG